MKHTLLAVAALAAALGTGTAHADDDDDCHDPVADWQPRETLRQMLEGAGWQVQRIKVDDGCYEVRGMDSHGNKVEAEYAPASLRIRSLEIEFADDSDTSDYPGLPTTPPAAQ